MDATEGTSLHVQVDEAVSRALAAETSRADGEADRRACMGAILARTVEKLRSIPGVLGYGHADEHQPDRLAEMAAARVAGLRARIEDLKRALAPFAQTGEYLRHAAPEFPVETVYPVRFLHAADVAFGGSDE